MNQEQKSLFRKIKACAVINRFEFTPVSQGIIMSFIILGIGSFKELLSLPVILSIVIYNIATYWGAAINVFCDYNFDMKSPTKCRLSNEIDLFGKKQTKWMLWFEAVTFLGLSSYQYILTKNSLLIILILIGTFFALAYSAEPFRFKRRGFLNSLSLFLIIMFLPPLYGWFTVQSKLTVNTFLMILGMALVQYGNGLYYTTADYTEDKNDGIDTPSVVLGVMRAVKVSLFLIVAGIVCLVKGYSVYHLEAGTVVIFAGQMASVIGIVRIMLQAHGDDTLMEKLIKKYEMHIPVWVALASFSVLIACILSKVIG